MAFDATFFAFVGLLLFFALIVYLKVPGMMAKALDERAEKISNELAEAKRLREEAQHLLAEYQRKRKDAEADAINAVRSAAVDLAIAAAERVLASKTDAATGKALFDNAIGEVKARLN